jgi:hypothetical protein
MKYQLVLQWPAASIENYDTVIAIEDGLIGRLSGESEVDGHDMGEDEVNIFIRTNDPVQAFHESEALLENRTLWLDMRAAYREVTGSKYKVLWPHQLTEFTVK